MDAKKILKLLRDLKALINCPSCGNPYLKEGVKLIGVFENSYLLELNCFNCQLPVLANLIMSKKIKLPALKINVSNKKRHLQKGPITANEIINTYQGLKKY